MAELRAAAGWGQAETASPQSLRFWTSQVCGAGGGSQEVGQGCGLAPGLRRRGQLGRGRPHGLGSKQDIGRAGAWHAPPGNRGPQSQHLSHGIRSESTWRCRNIHPSPNTTSTERPGTRPCRAINPSVLGTQLSPPTLPQTEAWDTARRTKPDR